MKRKHRLQHEVLERRQLLAANCVPLPSPIEAAAESVSAEGEASIPVEDVVGVEFPHVPDDEAYIERDWAARAATHGPDFIHEQGNQLFVLDQDEYGRFGLLVIFDRSDDGSLEVVEEIEVGFRVDEMIVAGDQIVLLRVEPSLILLPASEDGSASRDTSSRVDNVPFGPGPVPESITRVLTVNLGETIEVVRQDVDVALKVVDRDGSRLLMRSIPHPSFVPYTVPLPYATTTLHVFEIAADGIHKIASAEDVPQGPAELVGDSVLVAGIGDVPIESITAADGAVDDGSPARDSDEILPTEHVPISNRRSVIREYRIDGQRLRQAAELDLGPGLVTELHVSEDAKTITVIQFVVVPYAPEPQIESVRHEIELINFSDGQLRHFETVPTSGFPLATYSDYVLLRDHDGMLHVVDTNQALDVTAANRVRRIELPADFRIENDVFRVSDDRVVLLLDRIRVSPESMRVDDGGGPQWDHFETVVLTVSLRDARIVGDARLDDTLRLTWPRGFTAIDAESDRFGFFVNLQPEAERRGMRFHYGRLDESGEFVPQGSIAVGHWSELDANAERLIVREPDRLIEYRWDDVDNPRITPIGPPTPAVEAVDDHLVVLRTDQERSLNLLANDHVHGDSTLPLAQIVELIGAPDGVEISQGRFVRIPASVLEEIRLQDDPTLRFEYVISDGRTESRAVVEVEIRAVSDEVIDALVQRIRVQAAEDLGVSVDEVRVTSVEKIFDGPLPIVRPDGVDHPLDLSPGILVTLASPEAVALYAASIDGEIVQVFTSRREWLVELGLRAVDDVGEPISEVTEGQEFWIEFTAKDLRDFGRGVFAAFFDLVVPTEHIVLTGSIEYGDGFQSIRTGSLGDGFVDDMGAVSNLIESPGNGVQQILRMGAKAIAAGEVTLTPEAADAPGTESLIRGRETVVPDHSVRFSPLSLTVVDLPEEDPLDSDGNGIVSAVDALVIINFLHRFGTTPVAELEDRIASVRGEGEALSRDEMVAMRRYDTNASGTITALDALIVINRLSRERLRGAVTESAFAAIGSGLDDDDDDEVGSLMD